MNKGCLIYVDYPNGLVLARGARSHRLSFANNQISAIVVLVVKHGDGGVGFVVVPEFYESETAAAAGHLVEDDVSGGHVASLGEQCLKVVVGSCPRQTADK